jgi:hypothetical protein
MGIAASTASLTMMLWNVARAILSFQKRNNPCQFAFDLRIVGDGNRPPDDSSLDHLDNGVLEFVDPLALVSDRWDDGHAQQRGEQVRVDRDSPPRGSARSLMFKARISGTPNSMNWTAR